MSASVLGGRLHVAARLCRRLASAAADIAVPRHPGLAALPVPGLLGACVLRIGRSVGALRLGWGGRAGVATAAAGFGTVVALCHPRLVALAKASLLGAGVLGAGRRVATRGGCRGWMCWCRSGRTSARSIPSSTADRTDQSWLAERRCTGSWEGCRCTWSCIGRRSGRRSFLVSSRTGCTDPRLPAVRRCTGRMAGCRSRAGRAPEAGSRHFRDNWDGHKCSTCAARDRHHADVAMSSLRSKPRQTPGSAGCTRSKPSHRPIIAVALPRDQAR